MSKLTPNSIGKIDSVVRQEIFRLADQFVPSGDPSRDAALVMIAALFVGPSEVAVTEITGCPVELVSVIGDRLRASGLWIDVGTDYADWFADGDLGIANYGLDLDVAEGIFVRTSEKENGQYGYTLVGDGTDIFE
jgi:hypothetical protein